MKKLAVMISLVCLILFPLFCVWLAMTYIILMHGCNHTGLEFLRILLPLSLTTAISIIIIIITRKHKKIACVALILNILAIIFFIGIDRLNIMVQYDRWLERGLPSQFERLR